MIIPVRHIEKRPLEHDSVSGTKDEEEGTQVDEVQARSPFCSNIPISA